MRINFENEDQSVLWWEVNDKGIVAACGPSKNDAWINTQLVKHEMLVPGDKVIITGVHGPVQFPHAIESIIY